MSTFLLTRGMYSSDWIRRFDSSTLCYEFSNIPNRIGKKLIESSRTYAVKWQFLAEIPSDPFRDRFETQEQSMLFNSC
jgi:hypothetical protein